MDNRTKEWVLTAPKAVPTNRESGTDRNRRNGRYRRYVDDTAGVVVSGILGQKRREPGGHYLPESMANTGERTGRHEP